MVPHGTPSISIVTLEPNSPKEPQRALGQKVAFGGGELSRASNKQLLL